MGIIGLNNSLSGGGVVKRENGVMNKKILAV
jgi:hypothetical protein